MDLGIGVVVVVAIGVVDDVAIGLILNVAIGGVVVVVGICDDLFWKVVYGLSGQYLLLLLLQGLGKVNIHQSTKHIK